MPTNRKRISRKLRQRPSTPILLYLLGDASQARSDFEIFAMPEQQREAVWRESREAVLEEFVRDHPGRRPFLWWRYEAPEMRRRLGGVGDPAHEVVGYKPRYHEGIPARWIHPLEVKYFKRGTPIDPERPPYYESQCAFLQRHGLLASDEMEALADRPKEFEPEIIDAERIE